MSKGVALVEMCHKEGAEAVMIHCHGYENRGRVGLKIEWSTKSKTEMGLLEKREDPNEDAGPRRRFAEDESKPRPDPAPSEPARDPAGAGKVPSGSKAAYQVGQAVIVSGLKSAAHYNGAVGRIL